MTIFEEYLEPIRNPYYFKSPESEHFLLFLNFFRLKVYFKFIKGVFFFSATQKEVAIGIFADHGFTGHRIGEKQTALRVCTVLENIRSD